jgi:hypothetical protein
VLNFIDSTCRDGLVWRDGNAGGGLSSVSPHPRSLSHPHFHQPALSLLLFRHLIYE